MSRSVSTHYNSFQTVYMQVDCDEAHDWEFFVDDIRTVLCERFPSFSTCERWQHREDRIILENRNGEVSVSEYNGIVAVCLAPLDDENPLNINWCNLVAGSFKACLSKAFESKLLISQGSFSNGEQAFTPAARPEGLVTSKEGTLW